MSEFKRPPGVSDDPEYSYRRGYHHGAWEIFEAVQAHLPAGERERLNKWIQIDLSIWRNDREASPARPRYPYAKY